MAALKKKDWFIAALPVLKTKGIDGVTVDYLCASVSRTKGSFYHHFKDFDSFSLSLLEWWYQNYTVTIIDEVRKEPTPSLKMKKLFEYAEKVDLQMEIAIRGWAHFDTRAAAVMKKVDDQRRSFQADIYKEFITDHSLADNIAAIDYASFVGFLLMGYSLGTKTYKKYSDILQEAILALVERRNILKPGIDLEDLKATYKN